MGKPIKNANPYGNNGNLFANIRVARGELGKAGVGNKTVNMRTNGGKGVIARAELGSRTVEINPSHPYWDNPSKHAKAMRRAGFSSTSSPMHAINHEVGHLKDRRTINRNSGRIETHWNGDSNKAKRIARRVSGYATQDPREFVAETYAGRRGGQKYDHEVMKLYRREAGLPKTSVKVTVRRRKRK